MTILERRTFYANKCKPFKIGYDDKIVVPDFDVVIHKHDITTFIGPNGCGKSTILKALTRILKCGV